MSAQMVIIEVGDLYLICRFKVSTKLCIATTDTTMTLWDMENNNLLTYDGRSVLVDARKALVRADGEMISDTDSVQVLKELYYATQRGINKARKEGKLK